jgi:hypothetical protein
VAQDLAHYKLRTVLAALSIAAGGFAFGQALFNTQQSVQYSHAGAGLWLIIVTLLAALSSLGPAIQATRVPVSEVLSYE